MRGLLILVLISSLWSCKSSGPSPERAEESQLDSAANQITLVKEGSFLGIAKYGWGNSPRYPVVRFYVRSDPHSASNRYIVLHEYASIPKMLPKYFSGNKARRINDLIGYLKRITARVSVYKATPDGSRKGTYALNSVYVTTGSDGKYTIKSQSKGERRLILWPDAPENDPFANAKITSSDWPANQPEEIVFPDKEGKLASGFAPGPEYGSALVVYKLIGLGSTWRKNYLPGDYFAAYNKMGDTVLKLTREGTDNIATFQLAPERFRNEKDRKKVFTNPKSHGLEGKFETYQPIPNTGMFVYQPKSDVSQDTKIIIRPRIGLFIDIFDATEKLNQDVVELVIANPDNPDDFLMYYENPNNTSR